MAATFHPQVALRGQPTSPCTAPSSDAARTVVSTPSHPHTQSHTNTNTHTPSHSHTLPTHGLQLDATSYPLHPHFALPPSDTDTSSSCGTVRLITAHQYAQIVAQHSKLKLQDEKVLFPWLHGADIPNSAQAENFGYRNGAWKEVPRYRGMVTIAAHGPRGKDEHLQQDEEDDVEEEEEYEHTHVQHQHTSRQASTSSSSTCESIFVDPSCEKADTTLPIDDMMKEAAYQSASPVVGGSNAQNGKSVASTTTAHARAATSASIATSYSTDSFVSSTSSTSSSSSSSASSIFNHTLSSDSSSSSSSGLASSASSIYSYEKNVGSEMMCTSGSAAGEFVVTPTSTPTPASIPTSGLATTKTKNGCIDEEENALCDLALMDEGAKAHQQEEVCDPLVNAVDGKQDGKEMNTQSSKSRSRRGGKGEQHRVKYGPEEYASLLVNSHHPHEVLAYDANYDPNITSTRKSPSKHQQHRHHHRSHSAYSSSSSSNYSSSSSSSAEDDDDSHENGDDNEEDDDDDSKYVCFQSHPIPIQSISFRHFRLQRYKYITISDVFIYHPNGEYTLHNNGKPGEKEGEGEEELEYNFHLIDLAKKISVAQKKMKQVREQRGEGDIALDYNVYIITDPFEVFEEKFPHLVAVDSLAFPTKNKISFPDGEHEEMRKLTEASQIGENVFLGNTFDVPLSRPEHAEEHDIHHQDGENHEASATRSSFSHHRSPSISSLSSPTPSLLLKTQQEEHAKSQESQGKIKSSDNPHQFSICIEGRDMAAMCSTRQLKEREEFLDELQVQIMREKEIEERRLKEVQNKIHTSARGMKECASPSSFPYSHRKKKVTTTSARSQHAQGSSKKRRSTSAFWFSSSSSSSSGDEDELESTSASSEGEDVYELNCRVDEEDDTSDFEDFAEGQQELLYDSQASSNNLDDDSNDLDLTLSPGRFSMSLDPLPPSTSSASRASHAQVNGRCISPPPYAYAHDASPPPSSHSTPIKLQYKKSKSLRMARELEELARNKQIEQAAAAAAERKARLGKGRQEEADDDNESRPREILQVETEEIVHMECLSTAQTFNQASIPAMVDSIVEYVVWLRTQARPHLRTSRELQKACAIHHHQRHQVLDEQFPHQQQPALGTIKFSASEVGTFKPMARRVLIHCTDGYTDTSVLALAYIMYDQAISLPKAYLYLQNECHRSFFVYKSDVAFLQAIEKNIMAVTKSQGRDRFNDDLPQCEIDRIVEAERRENANEHASDGILSEKNTRGNGSPIGRGVGSSTMGMVAKSLMPRPGLFSRSSSKDSTTSASTVKASSSTSSASLPRGPSMAKSSTHSSFPSATLSPASAMPPKEDANAVSDAWFHSEHFDGHFPSRILDYLYLGNLSHASNALMLKELGITHVLSIGESALVPPSKQCAPSSPSSAARARTPTNSLWLEHSLGNIQVMDVQDINDDGVDSILPHLMSGIEFIEQARSNGGKILVHCRVGVSRSATIVIAQVMMDLNLSLAQSYLLVRARRLNILIQPTILFMHTLWTWEEEIRNLKNPNHNNQQKSSSSTTSSGTFERSGRICWPILATEIANLNYKYLNC